ncbi:MAG: rod shape-determining protein MreC [Candidatus Gracilibacteria bacterium]|nr:rod shape-determining protein MreC [Candidatus Gracilibacteria bacterium]
MALSHHKKITLFTSLFLVACLLLLLQFLGVFAKLQQVASFVLRPFTRVAYITNTNLSNTLANLWYEGENENEVLTQRVANLENMVVAYENLKKENELLRNQLNVSNAQEHEYVLTRIIGQNPDNFSKTVFLDRGLSDGLSVGMPVVQEDVLIGRLKNVYEHSSELQLVTDPESVLQIYLQESGAKGLLEGSLGLQHLLVTQVSKDYAIKEGEHVLSLGVGLNGVKDLLLGVVDSQITEDKATYQTLKVKPIFDLDTLEYVFVIKR